MFGKRAKNQANNQDQDFDGTEAEFAEDFSSQDQPEEAGWGDDQSDMEDSVEPELQDRRRSSLSKVLPFAALGVIAAGGAGFFYLNYMQPSASTPETAVIAAAPSEPEVTAIAPTDAPVLATAPVEATTEATTETAAPIVAGAPEVTSTDTDMFEPATPETVAAAPTDIQLETTTETAPVEVTPETAVIDTPVETVVAPAPVEEPVVTETAPVETAAIEPAPVVVPEVAPAAVAPVVAPVVTPTPAPVQVTAPVTAPATAAVADENLADMSGRMDVLERQIEDLTKAVDRMATNASGTAATPVDAELKNTVTALQDQVRKLQSELANVRTAPAAASRTATTASSDPAPARPAATRSTTAETPRSRPAATAPVAAPVRWVLRAAQSNEAWVSRSSEGELRSVTVGQSLEGIGRVTAIRQSGSGGWEVIGTQGSLRQ